MDTSGSWAASAGGETAKVRPSTLSWQNPSFRNYADYTVTPDFRDGMAELRGLCRAKISAIMCVEAVWWRCHRRIIADYLIADGEEVFHILGSDKVERASMNPAAIREPDGTLVDPGYSP
jgi:uncharacterized protein (DUF488 family)